VHQQDRTNTALALIIEQGIERDQLHGSVLAWKFMAANGVPDDMIARVLAHPSQRRQRVGAPLVLDDSRAPGQQIS